MDGNAVDLGSVALDSFRAVVTVVTLVIIGVLLVRQEILTLPSLQFMSRLSGALLIPALIFKGFGNGPTASLFETLWVLVAISLISSAVDGCFAWIVAKVFRVELWFQRWFVIMNAFPNLLSVPLVVIESLCNQVDFQDDVALREDNITRILERDECVKMGQVYVFLYALPFTFALFVFGVIYVSESEPFPEDQFNSTTTAGAVVDEAQSQSAQPTRDVDVVIEATRSQDSQESTGSGGMGKNSRDEGSGRAASDGGLVDRYTIRDRAASSAIDSIVADTSVEVMHLDPNAAPPPSHMSLVQRLKFAFLQPIVVSMMLALIVGLTPPIREVFYGDNGVLRPFTQATDLISDAAVPLSNLIIAGTLASAFKNARVGFVISPKLVGLSICTTVTCVITKMFVIPALHFSLLYAVQPAIPKNRLLMLVLYIESTMPTANLVVVLAHMLLAKRAAEAIALVMVVQYLVSIVSLMGFTGLALYLSGLS